MVTGIVRRIDELGRVVIPKELRRTLGIREGEEIEVTPSGGDRLILRKYSALGEMNGIKEELLGAVAALGMSAALTDLDKVVASKGKNAPKQGVKLSNKGLSSLESRRINDADDSFEDFRGSGILVPIFDGAVAGGVFVSGEGKEVAARLVAEFIKNRIK